MSPLFFPLASLLSVTDITFESENGLKVVESGQNMRMMPNMDYEQMTCVYTEPF